MVKFIPWDIWIAAALALAVALAGVFGPAPVALIVIFVGLCAYVVVQTINGKPR
jgi:hypothetical protein